MIPDSSVVEHVACMQKVAGSGLSSVHSISFFKIRQMPVVKEERLRSVCD